MDLERKVGQLTELMADLVPAIDQLVKNESGTSESISKLNLGVSELRQSNIKLAEVIDKLSYKIDRIDEFEKRLKVLEDKIL